MNRNQKVAYKRTRKRNKQNKTNREKNANVKQNF